MLGLLSWLPIIGPIVDGIVSMFSKYQDTSLGKLKTNNELLAAETQASVSTLIAFKDDIGIRLLRDVALTPPVFWSALIGWDTIIAIRYPWLKFGVADYPEGVKYIPYLAFVFLFGNVGMNMWKRK